MTPLRAFNETLLFYSPSFTREETAVLRAAYSALSKGPISAADLSTQADISVAVLEDLLARRPGLAQFGEDGRIKGYLGLSLRPTPHALSVNGQTLHTWCAWDGLFIPRVIGQEVRLTSTCPITGQVITLAVAPHGVLEVLPAHAMMSFVASRAVVGTVMGACCSFIHFLGSAEAGVQWRARHPMGCVLTIEEAWRLGQSFTDTRLLAAEAVGSLP